MHYKPIKITIYAPGLAKVIINVVVWLPDLIVTDKRSLFTLMFGSLLYHLFGIKWRLFTVFYPQTDSQTSRQNRIIEAYFWAFVNFE